MNERTLTERLMAKLTSAFRGAVVIKHNDRSTRFIPDIQILYLDSASWIEVKYLRKGHRLKDIVRWGQLIFGHQLFTTCGGRSWVVVYEEDPRGMTIWNPSALASTLYPSVTGGHPVEPKVIEDIPRNQNLQLLIIDAGGALRFEGDWTHDLIVKLVRDGIS